MVVCGLEELSGTQIPTRKEWYDYENYREFRYSCGDYKIQHLSRPGLVIVYVGNSGLLGDAGPETQTNRVIRLTVNIICSLRNNSPLDDICGNFCFSRVKE